mgnify:CR=1 FL=1
MDFDVEGVEGDPVDQRETLKSSMARFSEK